MSTPKNADGQHGNPPYSTLEPLDGPNSGPNSGSSQPNGAQNDSPSKLPLLSEATRQEIDHWVAKFPPGRQRSACIAALRAAQEQNHGFITEELMDAIAEYLKLPPIQVYEVAAFYSMFETHPAGRHHVSICTNISCMLNGAEALVVHAEKKLGIKLNESTPDMRIFLKEEHECLAACTGAPMCMVDHVFHEHLTPEKLDQILDELK